MPSDDGLEALGWGEPFLSAFRPFSDEGLVPARVAAEHRNRYVVLAGARELDARLSGRLRLLLQQTGDRPVVGDWVALKTAADGTATIQSRLPRRSAFSRKVAGRTTEEQVMAANVDTVILATAVSGDVNPRRIERYLLLAWESGAHPVIVLTKADLTDNVDQAIDAIRAVAQNVPVHVVSSMTGTGLDELQPYLVAGSTIAVLGSSGVGKSTLINRLFGAQRLRTGDVRDDGRGRHTTTNRELVRLPGGALIIDTPGLRELQLWESDVGLQEAFTDIEDLAAQCRFADCAHEREPGCAVRAAIAGGLLPADRLESYHRLRRELGHIDEKQDARARAERTRSDRAAHKQLKKRLKEKGQS